MRILGADVRGLTATGGGGTVVALDERGDVATSAHVDGLTAFAREVVKLSAGEPFLLAVDIPVVAPGGPLARRRVDRFLQRRLGVKLPLPNPGPPAPVSGSDLLAALATAGQPCLPYPDRDRRRSGLAEVHPEVTAKALLWEGSAAAATTQLPDRDLLLRSIEPPSYRTSRPARGDWPQRWTAVDAAVRALSSSPGFDLRPAREALQRAVTIEAVERAATILDAILVAGTARRYIEEPERCAFAGERETGYVILPADDLLRRVALREPGRSVERPPLFPQASLRQRLAGRAVLRPLELIGIPGRAQHIEAIFEPPPLYEFDNLDEMLWWKHCRHLNGPEIPADGLRELLVRLDGPAPDSAAGMKLARSRHKTLSFRFEPPTSWRTRVPPRDGKTYPFHVLRAIYEVGRG
jgi:predicted RNase H-like nuclease